MGGGGKTLVKFLFIGRSQWGRFVTSQRLDQQSRSGVSGNIMVTPDYKWNPAEDTLAATSFPPTLVASR